MSGKKRRSKTATPIEEAAEQTAKVARIIDIDDGAMKELKKLPEHVRDQFLFDFQLIAIDEAPLSEIGHLAVAGKGVIELKINGSPAYRCMYHLKTPGKVTVLHATTKTTNGTDKKLVETTKKRYKKRR